MKIHLLVVIFFAFSFHAIAQDETKDANTLKSEIKDLEKIISSQEKEIVKLEKSVVKVRPEAEQARRDAENISAMRSQKETEFAAFNYSAKKSELKSKNKELKSLKKKESKVSSDIQKSQSELQDNRSDRDVLQNTKGSSENTLSDAQRKTDISRDERRTNEAILKSTEPVDSLALLRAQEVEAARAQEQTSQRDVKQLEKSISKSEKKSRSIEKDKGKLEDERRQYRSDITKLETETAVLSGAMSTMNPKIIKKELKTLEKNASKAKSTHEKLQIELDQVEKAIAEKHDVIEQKKKEILQKQSILDRK